MKKPFDDATELFDFLEADEPDRYVFRGQTRMYDGPVLPSALRDRFTPFDTSKGPLNWAGVTLSKTMIDGQFAARRRAVCNLDEKSEEADDGKTTWELPETAHQHGFREFFNRSHSQRIRDVGNVLRESAIPGISELFGSDLGDLLCQQYGFTSNALYVTTDTSVAMFFATREAPFYGVVPNSPHCGVVYRWPKDRATIARNYLLPLEENAGFDSIPISFSNFIKDSADLKIVKDTLVRYTSATGERQKRMMWIVSEGERRSLDALCFPTGALNRSRVGRQRAALLWPHFEIVNSLVPRNDGDHVALIGDLLKTHCGEAFSFRHRGVSPPERLSKFDLWPSIREARHPPSRLGSGKPGKPGKPDIHPLDSVPEKPREAGKPGKPDIGKPDIHPLDSVPEKARQTRLGAEPEGFARVCQTPTNPTGFARHPLILRWEASFWNSGGPRNLGVWDSRDSSSAMRLGSRITKKAAAHRFARPGGVGRITPTIRLRILDT